MMDYCPSRVSLAKKAAAGFLWVAAANIGSRVITIVSTFILTRFLAPAVQGEVNAAFVFVQTIGFGTSLGVGQFISAHPKAGRDVVFHGSVLVTVCGAVGLLGCYLTGDAMASWLNVPGMAAYVPGFVVSHFIERLGWLPRNVLVRDMRFRVVGARVAIGEVTFASTSVLLAYLDFGGAALIWGNIARSSVALLFLVSKTDWRDYLTPCRLKLAELRKIVAFGAPISVSGLLHFGASYWDNLFMARRFGADAAGLYNQAYRLADLPANAVGEQLNDVLVPTFARLDDAEARRRGLLRAASLTALVVFPMAVGLGAIADTLVAALYNHAYQGVAPFLFVLSTLSLSRAISVLGVGYLQVVNRTQKMALLDAVLVVLVLLSMWLLAPLGQVAAAIGVGVAFGLNMLQVFYYLRPEGIRVRSVVGSLARPLLACLPMAAAVFGARALLAPLSLPAWALLLVEVAVGGLVYVGAALIVARTVARDFIELFLGMARRRIGAPPPAAT